MIVTSMNNGEPPYIPSMPAVVISIRRMSLGPLRMCVRYINLSMSRWGILIPASLKILVQIFIKGLCLNWTLPVLMHVVLCQPHGSSTLPQASQLSASVETGKPNLLKIAHRKILHSSSSCFSEGMALSHLPVFGPAHDFNLALSPELRRFMKFANL